ncbi:MAG: YbhN family protein [Actinomycetota bacterium]|nr:YbhN family protein [Actinomycetota bacterium]
MSNLGNRDTPENRRPRRSLVRRFTIRSIKVVALILIVEYLVLPQVAGARKTLSLIQHLNLGYVGLALIAEVAALIAYAYLTISVLPKQSLDLWTIFRIDMSSLALSHVTPAGTAGGTGLSIRLLITKGIRATDAAFAIAVQGIGSAVILNLIFWLALIISIPIWGFNTVYLTATIVGTLLFAFVGVLVIAFTRGERHFTRVVVKLFSKLPYLSEGSIESTLQRISERIRNLLSDPPLLRRALTWAVANWIFDAASLWIFLAAYGHLVNIDALLVSYGLANILAVIPITPAGLGVVEAALTTSLVGFGTPRGIAILGVISYRLINFWLPIPGGALAYLSLGTGSSSEDKRQRKGGKRLSPSKFNPNVIVQEMQLPQDN